MADIRIEVRDAPIAFDMDEARRYVTDLVKDDVEVTVSMVQQLTHMTVGGEHRTMGVNIDAFVAKWPSRG